MTPSLRIRRLLPLLALGATIALTASSEAQERRDSGTNAPLQVTFGSRPHWNTVPGTSVREIRQSDRPNYDMFRYGGNYYVYDNHQWYSSRRDHGRFDTIDEQRVPRQFAGVPREHWHNYPSDWADRNRMQGNGRHHYGNRTAQPGSAEGHR